MYGAWHLHELWCAGSVDVAQVAAACVTCPGVVRFKLKHTVVILNRCLKFREVPTVEVAKVRQDRYARLVITEHPQEEFLGFSKGSLQHQFLCFVKLSELVIAQVVGVVECVISHSPHKPPRGEI